MLLEEAVLYLLEASGYTPMTEILSDPTLRQGRNGLEVQGRGGKHQIDAIADFAIQQPFMHPLRLLVEAKFQQGPVGIEVMRNAVGVLQDVDKYWDYDQRALRLKEQLSDTEDPELLSLLESYADLLRTTRQDQDLVVVETRLREVKHSQEHWLQ